MAKIKQLEIKPPKLYRNWNENTISWDDAFRNYNESVVQSHLGEESLKQKGSGYMVSHRAEKLPEVKGAIADLGLGDTGIAHLYISIDASNDGLGTHVDTTDVFYWQQKGSSNWWFDSGDEWVLEEGDMVFSPKGVYHKVTSTEARFGISISDDSLKRHIQMFRKPYK